MKEHLDNIHLRKGLSLAELGIALVIMLIIATIATISYFTFIDDTKLTKMKEDASALQEAVSIYYAENGVLPVGEEVVLSDETKEIVSESNNGFCSTNVNGSIVSSNGEEIKHDGLVHSGIYSSEVDGSYTDLNLKAYTVGEVLVSEYFQNKTLKDFNDYLIVDCGNTSVSLNHGDNSAGNNGNLTEEDVLESIVKINSCDEAKSNGYEHCISTPEKLQSIGSGEFGLSDKYILMSDIDLSVISNWDPIGDYENGELFTGELNGNGYSPLGLFVGYFTVESNENKLLLEGLNLTGKVNSLEIDSGNGIGGVIGLLETYSFIPDNYFTFNTLITNINVFSFVLFQKYNI